MRVVYRIHFKFNKPGNVVFEEDVEENDPVSTALLVNKELKVSFEIERSSGKLDLTFKTDGIITIPKSGEEYIIANAEIEEKSSHWSIGELVALLQNNGFVEI